MNSSFRFGVFLYQQKILHFFKLLYLAGFYLCHKFGLISTRRLHRKACRHFFSGKSFEMLEGLVSSFLERDFEAMVNPLVAGRLKEAQAQGHYTVILSSSPNFLVKDIAKRFGVNEWAATEYSVNTDQTVGTVAKQMDGEDKAKYVAELMQRLKISKDKITGYSDSLLDFPFLEAVGHPIAVNPG